MPVLSTGLFLSSASRYKISEVCSAYHNCKLCANTNDLLNYGEHAYVHRRAVPPTISTELTAGIYVFYFFLSHDLSDQHQGPSDQHWALQVTGTEKKVPVTCAEKFSQRLADEPVTYTDCPIAETRSQTSQPVEVAHCEILTVSATRVLMFAICTCA